MVESPAKKKAAGLVARLLSAMGEAEVRAMNRFSRARRIVKEVKILRERERKKNE